MGSDGSGGRGSGGNDSGGSGSTGSSSSCSTSIAVVLAFLGVLVEAAAAAALVAVP